MDVTQAEEPNCSTEISLELKPVSSTYTYAEQQEYNQMCSASTSYENTLVLFRQINLFVIFLVLSRFAQKLLPKLTVLLY